MSKKNEHPDQAGDTEDLNTGDGTAESDGQPDEQSPEQLLEVARAEAEKFRESYLLAAAEAENIRKRAQNEMAQARKFAIERFAGELLSVRDSLELASNTEINSGDNDALDKMREGLELTLKQLDSVFEKFDISVIDPKGEKFNPDHHQAMTMVEHAELEPNHVVDVMQKGYLLNDRLLRPAMVVVSKTPAGAQNDAKDS